MRAFHTRLWIPLIIGLGLCASPAFGLSILLAPGLHVDIEITTRLLELGHSVTESDPATWDGLFDYSPYDVVAFEFSSSNPSDASNLMAAVDAGLVGVVVFRGPNGAGSITETLGLISEQEISFQNGHQASILAAPHPITQNHIPATYDLGYTNMCKVDHPGAETTTLVAGPDGAALVVHNTRRAVVTPFYGHFAGYDTENQVGRDLTERSLVWAAGDLVASHRTSWGAVKSLFAR